MDQEFTHSEDEDDIVDVAEEPALSPADEAPLPAEDDGRPEESEEEIGEEDEKDHGTISSDLIRGHINTIILRSLYDGDKYGYAILEEIARKSHNQYQLKQPSLYSALKRLEKEGYITSYWGGTAGGGRRKYFSLTDQGKEVAERNLMEWEYSRTVIDSLISDKDFDFSSPAPSAVDMRVLKQSTSRVPTTGEAYDEDEPMDEPMDGLPEEAEPEEAAPAYPAAEIEGSMPDGAAEEAAYAEDASIAPEEPAPEENVQEPEENMQTAAAAAAFPALSEPAPEEPENTFCPHLSLAALGRGFGAYGLPGDLTSPSRFVRAAFARGNSVSGDGEEDSVSQFFHILDFVGQPRGACAVGSGYESTIYSSCCCPNKTIFFWVNIF